MQSTTKRWLPDSICLKSGTPDSRSLTGLIYERTYRTDFTQLGFCVVDVGSAIDSKALRWLMLEIEQDMAAIHETQFGNTLIYLSTSRFDQQESTRPHLDGGPDECFLMLGYEPSGVDSELEITDYSKLDFFRFYGFGLV